MRLRWTEIRRKPNHEQEIYAARFREDGARRRSRGFYTPIQWKPVAGQAKPNSRIGGVEIGIISSSLTGMTAGDIIPSMLKIGLSEVELQSAHAEALAGAPSANAGGGRGAAAAGAPPPTLNANGLMPRCADMQMVLSPLPPGATPAPAGRLGPTSRRNRKPRSNG